MLVLGRIVYLAMNGNIFRGLTKSEQGLVAKFTSMVPPARDFARMAMNQMGLSLIYFQINGAHTFGRHRIVSPADLASVSCMKACRRAPDSWIDPLKARSQER